MCTSSELCIRNFVEMGLERFISAQEHSYAQALREIEEGQKRSHWMWYVFPQLKGLGHSHHSEYYGIQGLQEAKEYLDHEVLGDRLKEISSALLSHSDKSAREVMGRPDDRKLKSSMTLFASISPEGSVFHQVLELFYDGEMDKRSLALVRESCEEVYVD